MTAAVETVGDRLRRQGMIEDPDETAVTAFVRDHLPGGWTVDFNYEVTDWAATVLHGADPTGWPVFTLMRHGSGVVFASVWPCGSQVACIVDDLKTALGMIPGGIFEAAAGRHGAMDGPSDAVN